MYSPTVSVSSAGEVNLYDYRRNTKVDRPPRIGFCVRRSTAVSSVVNSDCVICLSTAVVRQTRRVTPVFVCVRTALS